jgi:predicted nucleic acid-binding protein
VSQPRVLIDTGPLIAFLRSNDLHHEWARTQLAAVPAPLLTCEAVMAEAQHLLRRSHATGSALLDLVDGGLLQIGFALQPEAAAVARMMEKYQDVPMSLADACLVRMSERHPRATVLTLDSDFRIYRRHGRQAIPVIAPFA